MMKNIGASITGIADTEQREIKFSALYMFTPNITAAKPNSWNVNCYNSDNTENPTEAAKISINNNGVLAYAEDVSTSANVFVKVHCTANYPNTGNTQTLEYYFRFKEILG